MRSQKMVFDFSKLRGRIIEKFGSIKNFALAADVNPSILSCRLHNKTKWPPEEIVRVSAPELLDIPAEEIHAYFFKVKF